MQSEHGVEDSGCWGVTCEERCDESAVSINEAKKLAEQLCRDANDGEDEQPEVHDFEVDAETEEVGEEAKLENGVSADFSALLLSKSK